jgi:hypothetical protein
MENSEDPDRKCWILRDKELHLNRGETNDKGPHAVAGVQVIKIRPFIALCE